MEDVTFNNNIGERNEHIDNSEHVTVENNEIIENRVRIEIENNEYVDNSEHIATENNLQQNTHHNSIICCPNCNWNWKELMIF